MARILGEDEKAVHCSKHGGYIAYCKRDVEGFVDNAGRATKVVFCPVCTVGDLKSAVLVEGWED